MQRYHMLIGGEWVDAASGETFESENPFLGGPGHACRAPHPPTSTARSRLPGTPSERPAGGG
jgi:hypothetical protein